MSITTVGTRYGDVVLKNVLCDNIKFHKNASDDDYTATLGFKDSVGVVGLLMQEIRNGYRDAPSFMVRASMELTVGVITVPHDDVVYVRRHQTLHCPTATNPDNTDDLRPGLYRVEHIAQYNPVAAAVVDIVFKNVHVAAEKCGRSDTNAVLHGGIDVLSMKSTEVVLWFPEAAAGDTCASKQAINSVTEFELHRHELAK